MMIPLHSVLPEIAQREVRCIHLGRAPGMTPDSGPTEGEYAYVEFYCDALEPQLHLADYVGFLLEAEKFTSLRSQIATLKQHRKCMAFAQ
jgi:hypothetical protein